MRKCKKGQIFVDFDSKRAYKIIKRLKNFVWVVRLDDLYDVGDDESYPCYIFNLKNKYNKKYLCQIIEYENQTAIEGVYSEIFGLERYTDKEGNYYVY